MPGPLSPRRHEGLVRLGAWMPLARAAGELRWFCGVAVGPATACRLTEAAGAARVALEDAAAERLERGAPPPPAGPPVQQFSADGAMVPLGQGAWAEAKTLAIGEVEATRGGDGEPVVRTTAVSYLSRLADAGSFGRLALGETHRRGTASAGTVAAVNDGAEGEQGLVDLHRPDAVRILDIGHALEHLNTAVQATFGEGTPAAVAWLDQQATELKAGDPDRVLAALGARPTGRANDPAAAAAARSATLAYLAKRRAQIDYARFRRLGLPIGSGMVESAHKTVVQQRLEGAGMHWQRGNVNPMLALRCAVCNDRWAEAWPRIAAHRRASARARPARPCAPPVLSAHQASRPARRPRPSRLRVAAQPRREPALVAGRPTAAHPWKQAAARAAARKAARSGRSAKS